MCANSEISRRLISYRYVLSKTEHWCCTFRNLPSENDKRFLILDAQFFMYVYFYSLHDSGSHVPIIRRIIETMRHLVYVTLCRWPSGMQEHMLQPTRRSSTQSDINQVLLQYNNFPDDGHMAAPKKLRNRNKGKVIPLQARCGPEGGQSYSSTLPWPRH